MSELFIKAGRVTLLGLILWMGLFSTGVAQQLKIGYVDVVRLKKEYKEYVAAEARFEKMMAVWQAQADSMQSAMKDIADKLEKPSPLLTEQGKSDLREKLVVKQNEYQLFANQVMGQDGEAAQKEADLSKPLIDKINTVIKLIALKGNYTFVLDSTAGSVIYANEANDLTDQVLAELNK
jgi:outer membrane protein